MNKLFKVILIIMVCSTLSAYAQKPDALMSKSVVLNASADDVWEVLRDLEKFDLLFPNFLADVWIEGDFTGPKEGLVRKCTAPGEQKGTVSYSETITEFDDEKRFYAYAVNGVPAKNMINMFKVVDLGYKKSMVIWNSTGWTFVENPQMTREQFVGFMGSALDEAMSELDKKFNKKS